MITTTCIGGLLSGQIWRKQRVVASTLIVVFTARYSGGGHIRSEMPLMVLAGSYDRVGLYYSIPYTNQARWS